MENQGSRSAASSYLMVLMSSLEGGIILLAFSTSRVSWRSEETRNMTRGMVRGQRSPMASNLLGLSGLCMYG